MWDRIWAPAGLRSSLAALVDAGIIVPREQALAQGYTFTHALLRDAAYESLLPGRRRELHAAIARAIDTRFPEQLSRRPEVMAHHLTEAAEFSRALTFWRQAGLQATAKGAYPEAIDHFRRALSLIAELPEGDDRTTTEIALQGDLGIALARSMGYAAPEVAVCFQRELELASRLGADAQFSACRRLATFCIVRDDFPRALDLIETCVRIADATQNPSYVIDAHNALGYIQAFTG